MAISEYTHKKQNEKEIYTGHMGWSGANFEVTISGSGNSTEYKIKVTGGQFDIDEGLDITITGEWEIMELKELLNLVAPKK